MKKSYPSCTPEKNTERSRLWRNKNPERYRKLMREWQANHPEMRRERLRQWRIDNPEKAKACGRKSAAKRRENPKYRLSNSISTGILQSIKKGSKINRHWEELVSFTAAQLRAHLEKLFQPGMTWENYGTVWEIDHKTPIAGFNFDRPSDIDFRLCWSLKNLQPLGITENRIKGDKLEKPFNHHWR